MHKKAKRSPSKPPSEPPAAAVDPVDPVGAAADAGHDGKGVDEQGAVVDAAAEKKHEDAAVDDAAVGDAALETPHSGVPQTGAEGADASDEEGAAEEEDLGESQGVDEHGAVVDAAAEKKHENAAVVDAALETPHSGVPQTGADGADASDARMPLMSPPLGGAAEEEDLGEHGAAGGVESESEADSAEDVADENDANKLDENDAREGFEQAGREADEFEQLDSVLVEQARIMLATSGGTPTILSVLKARANIGIVSVSGETVARPIMKEADFAKMHDAFLEHGSDGGMVLSGIIGCEVVVYGANATVTVTGKKTHAEFNTGRVVEFLVDESGAKLGTCAQVQFIRVLVVYVEGSDPTNPAIAERRIDVFLHSKALVAWRVRCHRPLDTCMHLTPPGNLM